MLQRPSTPQSNLQSVERVHPWAPSTPGGRGPRQARTATGSEDDWSRILAACRRFLPLLSGEVSPLFAVRLTELRLPTWAVFHELEPEQKGYLLASVAAWSGEARLSRLEEQESRYPGIREGYLQGRWHLAHQAFLEAGFGDLEAWSEVDRLVRRAGPDPVAEFSFEQALGPLAPLVREGSGTGGIQGPRGSSAPR